MKKNYIINIILVLSIIVCSIAAFFFSDPSVIASADSFFDGNGFYTISNSGYVSSPYYDYNISPVLGSNVSIPSNYVLIAYGFDSSSTRGNVTWYYADPSVIPFYFYQSGSNIYLGENSHRINGFYITNTCDSSGNYSYYNSNSFGYFVTGGSISITSFYPVYNRSGELIEPNFDTDLIDFSIVGVADGVEANISPRSGSLGTPYDVYLFPSSFPLDGGAIHEHLTSSTYITELSASEQLELEDSGFGDLLDRLQNYYNDEMSVEGSTWFKGIPQIHFFAVCKDHYINTRFNPDSYNLPYALISSFSRNSKVWLKRSDFIGGSRVYSYDHLCLIVVAHGDNNDTITRYDFTPALLSDSGVNPPSQISDLQGNYTQPTVSDFQELSDYIRYCFTINDNHRDIENANMIAYLQAIDWSGYMANGVAAGMANFLPKLSAEFDTVFNGLFDKYFVPDLTAIEMQIDADELAFAQKFAWVHQVKSEVNFIITTPLTSSGDVQYTIDSMEDLGVEESIVIFDTNWFDDYKSIIRTVFDVFGTIALVMYIFKTLPSTLGNMPSD